MTFQSIDISLTIRPVGRWRQAPQLRLHGYCSLRALSTLRAFRAGAKPKHPSEGPISSRIQEDGSEHVHPLRLYADGHVTHRWELQV